MSTSPFSNLLKQWRKSRKISQLELSLDAGISQRHLSFLESGRSRPGKDIVLGLAEALQMPLRDRNHLLNSAGFNSFYKERQLDDATMVTVRNALQMTLEHHMPYPAIVVDRRWNLYMGNAASQRLLNIIEKPDESLFDNGNLNIYRLTFSEKGLRPFITNWSELANPLLLRLQREANDDPQNTFLQQLLKEAQDSVKSIHYNADDVAATIAPVMSFNIRLGSLELKLFSMISAFGTALDVTASELKVETFFPADEATANFFNAK